MEIKSVPLSKIPSDGPVSPFSQAFVVLVNVFKRVVLPHLAVGGCVFLILTYFCYTYLIAPYHFPQLVELAGVLLCLLVYGGVCFLFSLLAASVCALRRACVAWEEFLEHTFDQVKENLMAHLGDMNEGLTKDQAKVAITGSVREVVYSFRPQSSTAIARWLLAFGLGCITLAMRSVLLAKAVKISGTTIRMSKVLAGKATLVGAVFLNLRFFSTVLLGFLYIVGFLFVWLNIWIILKLA